MSVGDVNSTEAGTGARYNDGKSMFEYQMIQQLPVIYGDNSHLKGMMINLGIFQMTGNIGHLTDAMATCYRLLTESKSELDKHAMAPALRVWHFGAQKYAAWNHAKGMKWSIPLACCARHYTDILEYGDIDEESGELHLAHIMCNMQMLLNFTSSYKEGNDLPFSVNDG